MIVCKTNVPRGNLCEVLVLLLRDEMNMEINLIDEVLRVYLSKG